MRGRGALRGNRRGREEGLRGNRRGRAGGGGDARRSRFALLVVGELACQFPVAAVASFLEAGNDLAEVGGSAAAADNVAMDDNDKMEMVRHDDIVLDLYHRIVGMDAAKQLLFHHLANLRKEDFRSEWVAIGLAGISYDFA